jgi:hypothetical protein
VKTLRMTGAVITPRGVEMAPLRGHRVLVWGPSSQLITTQLITTQLATTQMITTQMITRQSGCPQPRDRADTDVRPDMGVRKR